MSTNELGRVLLCTRSYKAALRSTSTITSSVYSTVYMQWTALTPRSAAPRRDGSIRSLLGGNLVVNYSLGRFDTLCLSVPEGGSFETLMDGVPDQANLVSQRLFNVVKLVRPGFRRVRKENVID